MTARRALVRIDGDTRQLPDGDFLTGVFLAGEVKLWTSPSLPDGFVACDGTTYNVADYPLAGSRLGSAFGGNGTTTFAVPDMRDRLPMGASSTKALASKAGSNSVTLSTAQLPAHNHTATTTMAADASPTGGANAPNASAPYSYIGGTTGGVQAAAAIFRTTLVTPTQIAGLATTTDNTGSGTAVDVTNAYVALRYIICLAGV